MPKQVRHDTCHPELVSGSIAFMRNQYGVIYFMNTLNREAAND
ncbi:MAG: hypothetical protein Q8O92_07610 [Candidatus Latescibacter sp.]|nr:hypothetical protein [Candidatus Latescibacter sp.]